MSVRNNLQEWMGRLVENPPEPAAACHIWAGLICPRHIDCLAHYHANSVAENQLALNKAGCSVRAEIWNQAWCINAPSLPLAILNVTGSPRLEGSWLKIWIWTFPEETQVGGHLRYTKNWNKLTEWPSEAALWGKDICWYFYHCEDAWGHNAAPSPVP